MVVKLWVYSTTKTNAAIENENANAGPPIRNLNRTHGQFLLELLANANMIASSGQLRQPIDGSEHIVTTALQR